MAAVKKAENKAGAAPILVEAGMVTVTVVGPSHVTHLGQLYKAGDTVHLPETIAATLVESGAVTKTTT